MSLIPDPLRPYADLLRWGAALLLTALLVLAGYRWGAGSWKSRYEAEVSAHAATRSAAAGVLDGLAMRTAEVAAQARAASEALATARRINDERYREALNDANRAQDGLRAALRRGSVQLRSEWTCPAAGPGAGGAAPLAGGQDATAELRAIGAANLVAGADRADAWIAWLQRELIDTRRAVVAAGCAVEASPD